MSRAAVLVVLLSWLIAAGWLGVVAGACFRGTRRAACGWMAVGGIAMLTAAAVGALRVAFHWREGSL